MLGKLLPQSAFARNVITLMTGTSIAQAIPIAISPILTRLYSPEEFGVFALYMAVVSIVSVIVTGRYELAILLPRKDSDAINIVALSVGLSCIISGVLLLLVILFNSQITLLLGAPEVSNWLYFLPATTLLTGIYQSLNYWSNRKSQYRRMAISRTLQSGGASAAQLGGGYTALGATGLIGGQLAGQVLSTAVLGRMIYREDQILGRSINKQRLLAMARKYSKFPRYLVVAHGFNTGSTQMPTILLSALYNSSTAGFYMLTQRVLGAPIALIAGAIGDVFRQEASHAYAHTGNCQAIYKKTFKKLLIFSFLPFLFFFLVAPKAFALVFGEGWSVAGEYARILTPMFFLRFVTSPLSQIAVIAQQQKVDLIWQIALFLLVVSALMAGYWWGSIKVALVLFCIVYCLMYSISGLINYRFSKGKNWRIFYD